MSDLRQSNSKIPSDPSDAPIHARLTLLPEEVDLNPGIEMDVSPTNWPGQSPTSPTGLPQHPMAVEADVAQERNKAQRLKNDW